MPPDNTRETKVFSCFQGIKQEHWPEMGYNNRQYLFNAKLDDAFLGQNN